MTDLNRVFLMGHIGNSLELKQSPQGKAYLRLSLATHTVKDAETKHTYWHKVVVFGAQAEVCATYLQKGSPIFVEGSLEPKVFTNKDGKKYFSANVIAQRIQFLGGRASAKVEAEDPANGAEGVDDDADLNEAQAS